MQIDSVVASKPQAPSQQSAALISSDFQTFLRMLTAQVQNQDPLNPMESGDFAVQLATFSGVEQQVRSNNLLSGLSEQLSQSGFAQMSTWLGGAARVPAPVNFRGEPVELFVQIPSGSEAAELLAFDEGGQIVRRTPMFASGFHQWAGLGENGSPLPEGTYRFELLAYVGEHSFAGPPVESYSTITEVRQSPEGVMLSLASGFEVPAESVSALRRASD